MMRALRVVTSIWPLRCRTDIDMGAIYTFK